MKFNILFILLFASCSLLSQSNNIFIESDTLKYGYRSSGSIDSMDIKVAGLMTNIPGGSFGTNSLMSNHFLFIQPQFQLLACDDKVYTSKYSSLPHLGFNYSFGSKGTQFLNVDYQQAINKKLLLNVNISQNSTQGILKNSDFNARSLQVNLRRNSQFFSYQLEGNYTYKKTKLNGGIYNDSVILTNGLEYVPVYSSVANKTYSEQNKVNLKLINYLNFSKDSINRLGLITNHHIRIENRVYNELMTSLSSYDKYQFDSTTTRDQFQLSSIKNGGGFFAKTKSIYFDALLTYRYWNSQNIGIHHDTSEVDFNSGIKILKQKYKLSNTLNYNLIGAKNEWSNLTDFYSKIANFSFVGFLKLEQKLPIPYQRNYISNNYSYSLNNYQLQKRVFSSFDVNYSKDSTKLIGAKFSFFSMNNNYFFIDSTWRNDTLNNFSNSSLTLHASYSFLKFSIQPNLTFSIPSANFNFIPKYNFKVRLFIKGKAFKSKKLSYIYGTDLNWVSDYQLMGYNRVMDVLTINSNVAQFNSMLNLDVFLGVTIAEFRMFAKVSNIGYFWNNRLNQQLIGYPIQKNIIQLGITWDFFN